MAGMKPRRYMDGADYVAPGFASGPTPGYMGGTTSVAAVPPKVRKFAAGTAAVPGNFASQAGTGLLDPYISGRMGPLAVGAAAAPQPPMAPFMPQPGAGTQMSSPPATRQPPVTPPTFGQELSNLFPAPPAPPPNPMTGHPVGRNAGSAKPAASSPGMAAFLGGAPTPPSPAAVTPNPSPNGKVSGQPQTDAAIARLVGGTPEQVNAFTEPHNYTPQEHAQAVAGIPLAVAERLWGMQHYLTPEQQLMPRLMNSLAGTADASTKAYQDAAAQGAKFPANELEKLRLQANADREQVTSFGTRAMFNNPWMQPQQQGQ
jgi:hypothetical protein